MNQIICAASSRVRRVQFNAIKPALLIENAGVSLPQTNCSPMFSISSAFWQGPPTAKSWIGADNCSYR
jgi:hypothetical protein